MSAGNATSVADWDALCSESLQEEVYALKDILDPDMSGTFNPHVLGFGVRLSTLVMNICAAILIRWGSKTDADAAVQGTLIQIGSIILCTIISIARSQLGFFDGLFTLAVVHSPIAWYILWINIRGLTFTVLVGQTLSKQVNIFFIIDIVGFVMYAFQYWVRHCAPSQMPQVPRWKRVLLRIRFIFKQRKWLIYMPIFNSYIDWSVEPGYAFSYDQSLSVVAAVPSLFSVLKLASKLRWDHLGGIMKAFTSDVELFSEPAAPAALQEGLNVHPNEPFLGPISTCLARRNTCDPRVWNT
ncbi:hypothetical protein B0H14DRAFT_3498895 [Mycena olivaceomarginata]|nr:hypothetical protein B0H14DRAFT_3498895 [Mycena olivaceomarginata]